VIKANTKAKQTKAKPSSIKGKAIAKKTVAKAKTAAKKVQSRPTAKPANKSIPAKNTGNKAKTTATGKAAAKAVQKTKPALTKGNQAKAKPVSKPISKPAPAPKTIAKPVVEKAKAVLAKVVPGLAKPKIETKAVQPIQHTPSMERTRYSDEELQEFRELINKKLAKARVELEYLQQSIKSPGENATDDSFSANKLMEDNSMSTEKEHMSQLAERMRKFVKNLEDALVRIENKTYGICKVTGKLISKDRLRAVPHTTMSIEAKLKQNK
jgi:RNA polymerase-binding transcription factor DksA